MLALVADGHTAGTIARRLLIGERTVHKHLQHLYAKLDRSAFRRPHRAAARYPPALTGPQGVVARTPLRA